MFCAFQISKETIRELTGNSTVMPLKVFQFVSNMKVQLHEAINPSDGIIDGSKIEKLFFPQCDDFDIFISHSHQDEQLAKKLASYLYDKNNLTCFIDSMVWGNMEIIQKALDDKYCRNQYDHLYDYDYRNQSTSHVHAMLSMSLLRMMQKTECVIFIKTDKSVPLSDGITQKTLSSWIYQELEFVKNSKLNIPKRHNKDLRLFSEGGQLVHAVRESLKIGYNLDLSPLKELKISDFKTSLRDTELLDSWYQNKFDILWD